MPSGIYKRIIGINFFPKKQCFQKGHIGYFKGKKLSKFHRKNIGKGLMGNINPLGYRHSKKTCEKMSQSRQGSKHWNWKGGKIHFRGYVLIKNISHPFCNNLGYVREHRLIMEKRLGRYLQPHERVHHINEIKNDNRDKNLQLFNNMSEHIRIHRIGKHLSEKTKQKIGKANSKH